MAGRNFERESLMLAGFALGLLAGLVVKSAGRQTFTLVRGRQWHRDYERTMTYDENLPDTLERREPPPEPGQPRFGGTGAIGVHPAAADNTRPGRS